MVDHKILLALKNVFAGGDLRHRRDFNRIPLENALASVHDEISRLAAAISSHADGAPYPQFAEALRRIGAEKQAEADRLKKWLGIAETPGPAPVTYPRPGKNHWERMTQDLQAQKRLNGLLQRLEVRVGGEDAETARLIAEIRERQVEHEKTLTRLISLADPQASQS